MPPSKSKHQNDPAPEPEETPLPALDVPEEPEPEQPSEDAAAPDERPQEPAAAPTEAEAPDTPVALLEEDDPAYGRALQALLTLGVPEELARVALAGHAPDSTAAGHAQARAEGVLNEPGAICPIHWPDGWDQIPANLAGVGCEHGSWVR